MPGSLNDGSDEAVDDDDDDDDDKQREDNCFREFGAFP